MRQFKTALFERTVLGPAKVSAVLSQIHPKALSVFKDGYVLDLLFFHRGAELSGRHCIENWPL